MGNPGLRKEEIQEDILMKRLVFSFLVIIAVYSIAEAKYSGGTGEPNDPYQIFTVADLLTLANDTNDYNKFYVLIADINLVSNSFTTAVIASDAINANWLFDGVPFTGVFNGNGHTISNLTINTGGTQNDFLGLFGQIDNPGEVKNLRLENVSITGGNESFYLGGLVGINEDGNTLNCCSTGVITGGTYSTDLGGLVGINGDGVISNCYSTATVSGGDYSEGLGGMVGQNVGNISKCYSKGAVTGGKGSLYVGGLVGENYYNGCISKCYSKSDVTSGKFSISLGGLIGDNHYGDSISDCYSTGYVTGGDYSSLGGLVGTNGADGSISNCFSTGTVSCSFTFSGMGGLVGENAGIISSSYFLVTSGPSNGYGTPLTDAQMKQQSSFVGWDFVWEIINGPNDIWAICEGVSYPEPAWQFVVGDSDNDKDVDFVDFSTMGLKWQQSDSNLYCGGSDLTGDGLVDLADLAEIAEHWLEGI